MKLIRAKDYADVSVKAAAVIASVVTLKPDCVLGPCILHLQSMGSQRVGHD